MRRAKQQMCLCQTCTNFKGYQRVLSSLPKLFEAVTHPPQPADAPQPDNADDAAAEEEAATWSGAGELAALLNFCSRSFKSEMVADVLCPGVLDLASSRPSQTASPSALNCLNSKCSRCGFQKLWSQGLRRKLVVRRERNGKAVDDLRTDAPVEFQSILKCQMRSNSTPTRALHHHHPSLTPPIYGRWTRISSSKAKQKGEQKELMHEQRSGTVIEFLDEFEREAMAKFPFHKFTILRQKAMDAQFSRNRCPGWYVHSLQPPPRLHPQAATPCIPRLQPQAVTSCIPRLQSQDACPCISSAAHTCPSLQVAVRCRLCRERRDHHG